MSDDRRMTDNGWHRVDPVDVPDDGRVRAVVVNGHSVALTRCEGRFGALENRCPHQGGPVGEGSIENGWLRCPWHGYDYNPLTGRPAACFAIAGPGSTNLLTGLYDAKLDGAPVIAISGQVPSAVHGRGAFQDVDLSAVFADVAVFTTTVQAGSNHAELAALAVK